MLNPASIAASCSGRRWRASATRDDESRGVCPTGGVGSGAGRSASYAKRSTRAAVAIARPDQAAHRGGRVSSQRGGRHPPGRGERPTTGRSPARPRHHPGNYGAHARWSHPHAAQLRPHEQRRPDPAPLLRWIRPHVTRTPPGAPLCNADTGIPRVGRLIRSFQRAALPTASVNSRPLTEGGA
jgi:hypothetical protein